MTIELNGRRVHLPEPATVAGAVDSLEARYDGRGVAVAVDGEVVPRSEWEDTKLEDGQRVEVVGAIQGG